MSDIEHSIKDRSIKVSKRKSRMPKHGVAMKRLLIERVARIRKTRP